jgi:hypothetical protein
MGGQGGGGNPPSLDAFNTLDEDEFDLSDDHVLDDYDDEVFVHPDVQIIVNGEKFDDEVVTTLAAIRYCYRRGEDRYYGPKGLLKEKYPAKPTHWKYDQAIAEAVWAKLESCPSLDDALVGAKPHAPEIEMPDMEDSRSECWRAINIVENLFAVDEFPWVGMAWIWRAIESQAMFDDPQVDQMIDRFNRTIRLWKTRRSARWAVGRNPLHAMILSER